MGGDPHLKSNKKIFSPLSNISNHSIKPQLKAFIIFPHILCRFPRRLHAKYGRYSIFKCMPRGPDCISCSLNARCRRGRDGAVLPFLYLGSKVQRIVPLPEYFSARRGSNETNSCARIQNSYRRLSLSPPSLSPLSGWREWKQSSPGLKKRCVPSPESPPPDDLTLYSAFPLPSSFSLPQPNYRRLPLSPQRLGVVLNVLPPLPAVFHSPPPPFLSSSPLQFSHLPL